MHQSTGMMTPDPPQGGPVGSTGMVLHDTYTLGPCIGHGGMGEVYEATHVRLPGRFAVKILRPDLLTNQDAVARFCREAEIMSELRHPHIIQIFDFNTSVDGLPYFVMEYLDGVDLQTRLAQTGALPLAAIVPIVDAVASALLAAHTMGVVHRDLKPANIFLLRGEGRDDDFAKVIDFGISKTASPGPRLSMTSTVMGTPAFMAPEQALGLASQIDARTDQFALAAITYLMLTGHEPFVGIDPVSVLYQVVHGQPPRLSQFFSWDLTQVQSVLDQAMAKRPEDRFDSIVAFAAALASAAESLLAHPASPVVAPAPIPTSAPPPVRVHAVRLVPKTPAPASLAPASLDDSEAPPPIRRPSVRPPIVDVDAVETPPDADLPRRLDRVPHGPQRAAVLGLMVLGLAAGIVHKGWYRGFPGRAANLEQSLVTLAHRGWRVPRSNLPTSIPAPTQSAPAARDPAPSAKGLLTVDDDPPAREPAAEPSAASDETAQPAEEALPLPIADRTAPRPATHHRRSGFSRSGWEVIELSSRPAPSPPAMAPEGFGSSAVTTGPAAQ